MSDSADRALEILADVLEAPEGQRDDVLERACAGRAELRDEVQRLLGLGPKAEEFLEALDPARGGAVATHPKRLGRYRILRLIAEGGMGSVYEAEQDHPRRHVALKVIKLGMDTRQVIARFEAERETLGLMDHPNIAAVHDAGVSDGGRPYFVMELVKGSPVTEYCQANKLPLRARLDLFICVCRAVQHAHQKGIIHRDLKPGNVLVEMSDGRPSPKVIDFGIAKATAGQRLTDKTLLTECRELIGTPAYMSPEQAEMSAMDVDTRSDIYSLGVLLYELLSGQTPFDAGQLSSSTPEEARRIIREVEPERPSTKLKSRHAGSPPAASSAGSEALARSVRGELDWIVMKCLEKDRTRRYATANELAADLERYLRHEPVQAGPPTSAYRLKKLIRRNRVALSVTAVMVVLLAGGITGTTIGLREAGAQALAGQRRAEGLLKNVSEAQQQTRREADRATAFNEFLLEMFRSAQPGAEGGGRQLKVVDLLDSAAITMADKFQGQPEAEINAREVLGMTYFTLGIRAPAVENMRIAYDLARGHLREDEERTLELGALLAYAIAESGGNRLSEAELLAHQVHQTARRTLGEAHAVTRFAAVVRGNALMHSGDYPGAEKVFREAIQQTRENPHASFKGGRIGLARAAPYHNLANVLREQGKLAEAKEFQREALRLDAAKPRPSTPRFQSMLVRHLGRIHAAEDELQEAATSFKRVLDEQKGRLGPTHPMIEATSQDYLSILIRMRQYDQAQSFVRKWLDDTLAAKTGETMLVAGRTGQLAEVMFLAGRHDEAARTFEDAVRVRRSSLKDWNWNVVSWRRWALQAAVGTEAQWKSQSLRAQLWSILDEALGQQPSKVEALDAAAWATLRFRLFRWKGDPYAPPQDQATLLAEGGVAELRACPDPSDGLHILAVEVSVDMESLRSVKWFLCSPWKQSLYAMSPNAWKRQEDWQALLGAQPLASRTAACLCLSDGLTPDLTPKRRDTFFGVVATTTLDLPRAPYRFAVTSDDGFRLSVDGQERLKAWVARGPRTDEVSTDLPGGRHELRVEFFQLEGGFTLWLRAEPLTGPAAVFTAQLRGAKPETLRQQLSDSAQRLEARQDLAEAASRYRLAGEIDDVIASRKPDEQTESHRRDAEAFTRQGKHAEAAKLYKQLLNRD